MWEVSANKARIITFTLPLSQFNTSNGMEKITHGIREGDILYDSGIVHPDLELGLEEKTGTPIQA